MAHSCRWRFPARPGGITSFGTGRRGGRIRINATLLNSAGIEENVNGLGPGFDAALQVSAAIGSNLQKFRDVLGESSDSSSGEEEFGGFTTDVDDGRLHSPEKTSAGLISPQKKPRGRPPRNPGAQRVGIDIEKNSLHIASSPTEKIKRQPGRPPGSGERRRGRPPGSARQWIWKQGSDVQPEENVQPGHEGTYSSLHNKDNVEDEYKERKKTLLGSTLHQTSETKLHKTSQEAKGTKLKRLQDIKKSLLKSKLKAIVSKTIMVSGVQKRGRGRPPSAERLKAEAAAQAANTFLAQETVNKAPESVKNKAYRAQRAKNSDALPPHELRESSSADQNAASDMHSTLTTVDPVTPTKVGRPLGLRQSPRHIKPVRVVPPTKRTDTTIAKQLLQRAKKGAQKKKIMVKDSAPSEGAPGFEAAKQRRRTQLTNIRQFIMPVVSTVSLRIIKTPKRFIDEGSFSTPPPHMKIARMESAPSAPTPQTSTPPSPAPVFVAPVTSGPTSTPGLGPAVDPLPPPPPPVSTGSTTGNTATLLTSSCNNSTSNGRFSSSAASCGSSAVSQHSSQLSSGESSRSSSPSLDDSSCDSQASEGTQALSEEGGHSPTSQEETEASRHHASQPPSPVSETDPDNIVLERSRRGRRGQSHRRGAVVARGRGTLIGGRNEVIKQATVISQVGSQHASSTASSASPPPLLSPPQPPLSASSNTSEHHSHSPWMMSHSMASFLTPSLLSSAHGKSRSILREPTFRWTSLSCGENKYFSSAKYAKEGLIRKPTFDNFRPPPLTPEDVGLMPPGPGGGVSTPSGFTGPGGQAGTSGRLFSPLHHHPRHNHHQHSSSRFDSPLPKRSPILRPPFFTASPAHSRIFESVTLPSSSGSSPGSLSPLQVSPTSNKKRKGSKFSRGQPRSPSHSMTTRSSQSGPPAGKTSEQFLTNTSVPINVTGNSSPLPGVAVSPLAPSALAQACFSGFPPSPVGLASHVVSDGRRAPSSLSVSGNTSSHIFPLFTSISQGSGGVCGKAGRERSASASRDAGSKEKEEKSKDREKENKKDGRREWDKRGKSFSSESSSNSASGLFSFDAREIDDSLTHKKTPCRKKSVSVDYVAEACPSDSATIQTVGSLPSKGRLSKKGRPSEKNAEMEGADGEKDKEKLSQSSQMGRTTSIGSLLARAEKQPVTDRRVARLLGKAKAQLNKIEKREVQPGDQTKLPGQENDSTETLVRGPRIKHVCRRAAVALGRNRAVFPDDMPTLSALPWEEREKILSSMGNDDKSSVAGSEEAEPPILPIKPVTRQKMVHEAPPRKGRRSRRCGQCPGCQIPDDCGVCTNCLDKPKFGGRNIKKQCCKVRKCQNLQWMPSKFLQKQTKGKRDRRRNKSSEKKEPKSQCSDSSPKPPPPPKDDPPPHKNSETPPQAQGEDKQKQTQPSSPSSQVSSPKDPPVSSPADDHKHSQTPLCSESKKEQKQLPGSLCADPSSPQTQSQQPLQQQTQLAAKQDALTKPPEPKKKFQQQSHPPSSTDTAPETKLKKQPPRSVPPPKLKPKEKEKQPLKTDSSTLNSLSTPSTGDSAKQKMPCDGVHRIRVDFKEDYDIENVWEMGGLSILTSVPITPRVVCFLCASSGNVEFVFCQVCCEPFHLFCLGETERPNKEHWENWCCRRCRFCHVCGHKYQKTKLLECDKCRNSYHPECLGPNHPTKFTKKRVWICSKCVRCKHCGATKPGKACDAQWSHDFSLCHDCAKLLAKGNSCPVCKKGYDVDDCDGKMMKCKKCDRWVHAKCENLTDDMCEILSSLPERVSYTCRNCTKPHSVEWRTILEKEVHKSMQQVLTALLNSRTSTHLLHYRQMVMKPPELNPETEESLPSRRSPEGPDPPLLMEVLPSNYSPLDLESVAKKMNSGCYKSVLEFSDDIVKIIQMAINVDGGQLESRKANIMLKCFFIRQMERLFPWYQVKESKFWETHKLSADGLLSNAMLPLSLDHNYAQSQERAETGKGEQPVLVKKTISPLNPKAHVDLNSQRNPTSTSQLPTPIHDHYPEDSPVLPSRPEAGDDRKCAFCLNYGDEDTNDCGRLLYMGQNEWSHVNCALWSAEVFEDVDCALKNVHMAVNRGKQLKCTNCHKPGATVSCCLTSCTNNYHFMCARRQKCAFLEDRKVFCWLHKDLIKGEVVPESGFKVTRRVLVDLGGVRLRRKFVHGLEPDNIRMMIGSMTIDCLGMLTELSDCESKLFPVGYQCSRVYWSTIDARKRCVYKCRVLVCQPALNKTINNNLAPQELGETFAQNLSCEGNGSVPVATNTTKPSLVPPTQKQCRVYVRNRHPNFPPCHRFLSNRPLPSPDGFGSSAHEIVTVGDPLLISSLPSIGSRRHSMPCISTHQPKKKVPCPAHGVTMSSQKGRLFAPHLISSSTDSVTNNSEEGRESSEGPCFTREANSENSRAQPRLCFGFTNMIDGGRVAAKMPFDGENFKLSQPASVSQASPPLATAILTGHKRVSGSLKNERGRQTTKETDLPSRDTFTPSHPLATLPKDNANPVKEKDPSVEPQKSLSPQRMYNKFGTRKFRGCMPSPATGGGMKLPLSSAAKAEEEDLKHSFKESGITVCHRTSRTKEKHSKVELNVNTNSSKERKTQNQPPILNTTSKSSKDKTKSQDSPTQNVIRKISALSTISGSATVELTNLDQKSVDETFKIKDKSGFEKELGSAIDVLQSKAGTDGHVKPPQECNELKKGFPQVVKKSTEKLPLTSQILDPNANKAATLSPNIKTYSTFPPSNQVHKRRSSRPIIFSPSASSESCESESHFHPDESAEHQGPDDGEENNLEDDRSVGKHNEEDSDGSAGSAKRRYPRRSARARSNMFFGLTPFYGVRSYGEEDLPFYKSGEISMKKRVGGSKRSAEGQVDGADDISTSSADSGEDEGGISSNKEAYYYNFTRTIINPNSGLPSIAGIDQCLGRGSQIDRFLRDQEEEQDDDSDEVSTATKNLELQQIGQLDGVDDGSESDISTTTVATSSTHKTVRRKGRDNKAEKPNNDSGKESVNTISNNSRENRKNQKDNSLPLGNVKTQGQDNLETPLSDLLKSDSDNIISDDCGNILPSDIMEFVLNTPSMQALAQQTEAPSSEQFSLDESYGVDVNQRKDILFEDFNQPLTNAEPGETPVSTSIAVEEPYGLPLELPSDLSVLTTRSPTVNNQNHSSLISETSDQPGMALATEDSKVEKTRKKTRTGSTASNKSSKDEHSDTQIPEEQLTRSKHFIASSVDDDHITSPGGTSVGETGKQDLTRTSGTPVLPNSPTVPLQSQKFIPVSTGSSGPAPITNPVVQANASPLKPGPEKLIVLNQHLQPLYVLQTLPNGVTQKIQIAPSVGATSVMNTSTSVLTGLSGGISTTQSIFPAGSKGLLPVSHHPQIQAFTGTSQSGFQPVIPNPPPGLLIGVTSHDSQIGVTETGSRHDHVTIVTSAASISPAPTIIPSGHGKKRLISRLQSSKTKKQTRSKNQPTLAPSDVGSNMTLINLSPSQIAAGISSQAGLVELGTITATSHRKIPNIIKRPKQGVMFLEPTLLPQPMPISTTQPSILGHDSHLIPCTLPGLNPNQSVLNVVSVPSSATGNFLGGNSVSLSAPGLISSTEITGSISNLLIKANPHNLSITEQPMVLHSGTPMLSHLANPSICVFPQNQSIGMPLNSQSDKEGTIHLQHSVARVLADKNLDPNIGLASQVPIAPNPITQELNKGHVVSIFTQSSRTSPISRAHQHHASKLPAGAASTATGKGKQKVKRARPIPEKSSGKKHKVFLSDTPTVDASAIQLTYIAREQEMSSPEPMDIWQPNETGSKKGKSSTVPVNSSPFKCRPIDYAEEKPKSDGPQWKADGTGTNGLSVETPEEKDPSGHSCLEHKLKKGLIFEICSEDGFHIRCESIEEAWKSLTDKVQKARSNAKLKALSFDGVNGLKMMGVVHDAVLFLLEQLHGARHCRNYRFRFNKPKEPEDPPINPHGSARAEVYHRRSVLDMFNFLASKHRQSPLYKPQEEDGEELQQKCARRLISTDLPLPVKLRELKKVSRDAVGVYRSAIHGRGLFCRKNMEAGDMVIEYSGNVIRSVLTEKRERHYDDKGIGCYMFRIDDYEVVDATMHGNAARFINHSCEPNCFSRVVNVDGQKHIVIFTTRKIYKGEELTYDYKFPIEEPGNKLPCNCGAKTCRKFLN